MIRETIPECPLSAICPKNCFDPLTATEECKGYYTQEEMRQFYSFVFGHAPSLLIPEESGVKL
jgi:hypothetical protein